MTGIEETIREEFLRTLEASDVATAELVGQLRVALAQERLPKAEELVRLFASHAEAESE